MSDAPLMTAITTSACTTRILDDAPSAQSEFESHVRVAKAIASTVNEPGGRSIALIGEWGSGKSSVVKLLPAELTAKPVIFDAWEHQGDPLRRTLLEQLIEFAIKQEWVNEREWTEKKEHLYSPVEITETREALTFYGFVVLCSALAVTVGFTILVQTFGAPIARPYANPFVAAVIMAAGLVSFLLTYFWTRDSAVLSLLFQRGTTTSRRSRTPDPTSIEFQSTFRELMAECLVNGRRLLVVVDNLDRIDPEEGRQIWGILRTFFDVASYPEAAWKKDLWLLVPFDLDALKYLWDKLEVTVQPFDGALRGRTGNSSRAEAFAEKNFQVRFYVSPLLLADWHAYLKKQLRAAFPMHIESDFEKVVRIVAASEPLTTPRKLKLFVNNLGALHRQWCGVYPLSIQALYLATLQLYGKDLDRVVLTKSENTFPGNLSNDLIPDAWQESLIALNHGVTTDKAIHIILASQIDKAIENRDQKVMLDLSRLYGFPEAFTTYVEQRRGLYKTQPELASRTGFALAGVSGGDRDLPTVWTILSAGVENAAELSEFNEKIADGFASILRRTRSSQAVLQLLEIVGDYHAWNKPNPNALPTIEIATQFIAGTEILLDAVKEVAPSAITKFAISQPFLYILIASRRPGDTPRMRITASRYRPRNPIAVVNMLVTLVANNQYNLGHERALEHLLSLNLEGLPLEDLERRFFELWRMNNNLTSETIQTTGRSFLMLYKADESRAKAILVEQRTLLGQRLYKAVGDGDVKSAAIWVVFMLLTGGPIQGAYQSLVQNQSLRDRAADAMAELLSSFSLQSLSESAISASDQTEQQFWKAVQARFGVLGKQGI